MNMHVSPVYDPTNARGRASLDRIEVIMGQRIDRDLVAQAARHQIVLYHKARADQAEMAAAEACATAAEALRSQSRLAAIINEQREEIEALTAMLASEARAA